MSHVGVDNLSDLFERENALDPSRDQEAIAEIRARIRTCYERYTSSQLNDAYEHVDKAKYPERAAIIRELCERHAVPTPRSEAEWSALSAEEIKLAYKRVFRSQVLHSAFLFPFLAAALVSGSSKAPLLKLSPQLWNALAMGAGAVYLNAFYRKWKCPRCGKFPGAGWQRRTCRACGVELR